MPSARVTVADFCNAVAVEEGYFRVGCRPQRNRNPGDLRGWPGQPCDPDGFARFASDREGWEALEANMRTHKARYPRQTLIEFLGGCPGWPGYAPASDGNDPLGYAADLAELCGVDQATFRMGDLA